MDDDFDLLGGPSPWCREPDCKLPVDDLTVLVHLGRLTKCLGCGRPTAWAVKEFVPPPPEAPDLEARLRALVQKAHDDGYRFGYSNGRYDQEFDEEDDASPGDSFDLWLNDAFGEDPNLLIGAELEELCRRLRGGS